MIGLSKRIYRRKECVTAVSNIVSLEEIAINTLNEYLEEKAIQISQEWADEIIDYIKYSMAVGYLMLNKWGEPISLSKVAVTTFNDGNYHFQDDSGKLHTIRFNQFLHNDTNFIKRKSEKSPKSKKFDGKMDVQVFSSFTDSEFKTYYHSMLNFYDRMTSEKIRSYTINKRKPTFESDANASNIRRLSEPKMKLCEMVEFFTGYYMWHDDKKVSKHLKNTYRRFINANFDKISFENYAEMIFRMKAVIHENTFDEDIFATSLFKFYSYYNIEKRYMYEIVTTIASCLRYIKEKRMMDKSDRDLFLTEVVPLMQFPLLNIRNILVRDYLRKHKSNELDEWRANMKTIKNIVYDVTAHVEDIVTRLDEATFDALHAKLVHDYEASKNMSQFNSFENNYKYKSNFGSVDYKHVLEHYKMYLTRLSTRMKEFAKQDAPEKDVELHLSELRQSLNKSQLKLLDDSFEYIIQKTLTDMTKLIDTSDLI